MSKLQAYCLACLTPLLFLSLVIYCNITGEYDSRASLFIGYAVCVFMLLGLTIAYADELFKWLRRIRR
jgi:hypothetical protein